MTLKTNLYQHQIDAVKKLIKIKVGALYMEMGTGKTRTTLELVKERYNAGKVNHILWLCPFSVKKTIQKELEKHVDGDLSMFTICGIETLSSSIRTSAQLLRLVRQKKVYLVVDESNLVKNHKAKRTERITWLSEDCKYKLILNGTPISRNEADLYAQWYILDWRILGYRSFWSFSRNHIVWSENIRGKVDEIKNVDYLVRKIAPYSYQVTKDECLDLPRKTYQTYYYDLTEEQFYHYQYVANTLLLEVDEYLPHTIYRMFTGLHNVISGLKVNASKRHLESCPFFKNPRDNPRMKLLLDILDGIDEKVIVFCKYTHEINDIINVLDKEYGPESAVPFYGDISDKKRQENIMKFKKNTRFFVTNKTTAGYGLNLQFCRYVIYYTNDWDYATRCQSEDRVHRIGQDKNVHIIDICADGTLDERILKCLWRKENMIDSFKYQIDKLKGKSSMKEIFKKWIDGKE